VVEDLELIDDSLANALDRALSEIRTIQTAARAEKAMVKPRWPMIVLRTPKACSTMFRRHAGRADTWQQSWTGPKEVDGQIIKGSFHSHQVPLPKANSDAFQTKLLFDWLSSHRIQELVRKGVPSGKILDILPKYVRRSLARSKLATTRRSC
jgi:xylulose-5-phosphate/fructose-6-phosphate phosphoketolase